MESSSFCRTSRGDGSIFTPQEWREMYPQSTGPHATKHTLNYLIANGSPSGDVLNYMRTPQGKREVKKQDSQNHHLTPLAVAVMTGQADLAEKMLKSQAVASTVTTSDQRGWTPMHHAVLRAPHLLPVLRAKAAGVRLENSMGMTPEDLERLIGRTFCSLSASRTFFKTPQGYVPFSGLRDLSTTGIKVYTDDPIFPPEEWRNLWEQVPPSIELGGVEEKIKREYFKWRENPSVLKVAPCPQLQGGASPSFGLFAAKTIYPGTVIGEYSGVVVDSKKYKDCSLRETCGQLSEETAYVMDSHDARNVGSATRWINCGFPNAIGGDVFAFGAKRYALMAVETIKAGEEVLIDYGISQAALVFGTQKLLRRERMEAFFQSGLEPLVQQFLKLCKIRKVLSIQCCDHVGKILFPLDNPMALLYLHFKKLVSAAEWFEAIRLDSENPIFSHWIKKNTDLSWAVRSILMRILHFEKELENLQELKEPISHWILAQIEKLSVMQILKGLDLIGLAVSSRELTMENWERYSFQLGEQLSSYNWIEDEEGPMSFERRYQDYKKVFSSLDFDRKTMINVLKRGLEPYKQFVRRDTVNMVRRYLQELEGNN